MKAIIRIDGRKDEKIDDSWIEMDVCIYACMNEKSPEAGKPFLVFYCPRGLRRFRMAKMTSAWWAGLCLGFGFEGLGFRGLI